jgi:hypothetical protein
VTLIDQEIFHLPNDRTALSATESAPTEESKTMRRATLLRRNVCRFSRVVLRG